MTQSKEINTYMNRLGSEAKEASLILAQAYLEQKNEALSCISEQIESDRDEILSINKKDLDVIKRLKNKNIPVVVVLFSGRPMIITDEIDQWDSLVAAWLPGTEGQGISDVLFGDYNPTGKLSFSWPKSINQFPITKSDSYLFDFGYGLSY